METIQRNRVTSAIIGGAIVLILIALLSSLGGGGDGTPADSFVSDPTPSSTPSGGGDDEDDLTEQRVIDCDPLLTSAEEESALGLSERPSNDRNTISRSRNETCTTELASDGRVFVQITPGTPEDFEPGVTRLGVTGRPVDGVGEAAVWFGGPNSQDGGRAGVLSVSQETSFGVLYFRIILGRPGLEEARQLEIATALALDALPRFPWVESPEPPAPVLEVLPPADAPDLSAHGFVGNLLQKEADGEWTRGEGLVATLRLMSGEAQPNDVLRHPETVDFGTGVIQLALAYLDEPDDDATAAEIEQLLAPLTRVPTPVDSEPAAEPTAEATETSSMGIQIQDGDGLLCLNRECELPGEPGSECAWGQWFETPGVCEMLIKYVQNGEKEYRYFGAETEGVAGWFNRHVDAAWAELLETHDALSGQGIVLGSVDIVETNKPGLGHAVASGDRCEIQLNTGWQLTFDGKAEQGLQAVAYLVAQCALLDSPSFDAISVAKGWVEGGAWFISDWRYGTADYERGAGMITRLRDREVTSPLLAQNATAWAFLEHLGLQQGIAALKGSRGDLATRSRELHAYHRELSDGRISDFGGGHSYSSPPVSHTITVTGPTAKQVPVQAMGAARVRVVIDLDGEHACMDYSTPVNEIVSFSPGTGGAWTTTPPDTLNEDATFLVTSHNDGVYTITVTRVEEDPDDCKKEEEPEATQSSLGSLECLICPITNYVRKKVGQSD